MMSGGHVSWCIKLQKSVALSTSEAEYLALVAYSQEVMFLHQLLPTIGYLLTGPTPTYEDNESCIALVSNDMTTSKSKHVDIKYHYIRDLIMQGSIELFWCLTDDMLADMLTKIGRAHV